MKNITKTTKTILFASLIAALILPFSGMEFATAASVDDQTKNHVNDKIADLNAKKSKTDQDNYELKKLKLVNQWIKAKEQGNEKRMANLMEKITADFPADDQYTKSVKSLNVSESGSITAASNPFVTYTGSTEKHYDCNNPSVDILGYIDGSITGYSSAIYSVTNMNYPFEITDGPVGINCTTPDWDNSKSKFTEVLNPSANCVVDTFTSSTDSEGDYCTQLSAGSLVAIEGQSWYDGNIIFSPWASSTIKYIG